MGRLDGRVALVTGGGSGIGAASATACAREGATVAVTDIDLAAATEVAVRKRERDSAEAVGKPAQDRRSAEDTLANAERQLAQARDDQDRIRLEASTFKGKKVEVSRFKGLGEMNPMQLRETTMDPKTRSMIKITLPKDPEERFRVRDLVERLMGRNPEHRFHFIQAHAAELDEEAIDA